MYNEFNRKPISQLLPRLPHVYQHVVDYAQHNNKPFTDLADTLQRQTEGMAQLLQLAKDLTKQATAFLKDTPMMVHQPIAALDRTLETLYFHYGQRNQTTNRSSSLDAKQPAKTQTQKGTNLNDKRTVKQAAELIKPAVDSDCDEKRSTIEQLEQRSLQPGKCYCACKGKKGLTYHSYLNHIMVCHNNVVPEGSSHDLDGRPKKRKPSNPLPKTTLRMGLTS